jgi:hypothetical protein
MPRFDYDAEGGRASSGEQLHALYTSLRDGLQAYGRLDENYVDEVELYGICPINNSRFYGLPIASRPASLGVEISAEGLRKLVGETVSRLGVWGTVSLEYHEEYLHYAAPEESPEIEGVTFIADRNGYEPEYRPPQCYIDIAKERVDSRFFSSAWTLQLEDGDITAKHCNYRYAPTYEQIVRSDITTREYELLSNIVQACIHSRQ